MVNTLEKEEQVLKEKGMEGPGGDGCPPPQAGRSGSAPRPRSPSCNSTNSVFHLQILFTEQHMLTRKSCVLTAHVNCRELRKFR